MSRQVFHPCAFLDRGSGCQIFKNAA
jgi:hypothetical protein